MSVGQANSPCIDWGEAPALGDRLAELAALCPDRAAYIEPSGPTSWATLDRWADEVAALLIEVGIAGGDRVAVLYRDSAAVHAIYHGVSRAGAVVVGIGARAGDREIDHLLGLTGARMLVTGSEVRGRAATPVVQTLREAGLALELHLEVVTEGEDLRFALEGNPCRSTGAVSRERGIAPDDLFLLNSTSGTTGLPKCVMHTQRRWFYFHHLAAEAGCLTDDDVVMGVVPAPFGFGLWTAHFTPTLLGSPCVVMDRFNAAQALDLIQEHRVSVLCCVSTQFILMLDALRDRTRDLSSLRCMFTGGEAVPYEAAAGFEAATGATILQFYGSNETGALSCTTLRDPEEIRLRSAGHLIDDMQVRVFDPDTRAEVSGDHRRGQPACRGPATSLGYWGDAAANEALFTDDGWMLMGDIVEVDERNVLKVVGRTSDFIIRGGKNISAPAVEAEVASHPAVVVAAAVAVPDAVFGERVGICLELREGERLDLPELVAHLEERGVSKEWFPEHLLVLESLPRSSGGKIAKAELRAMMDGLSPGAAAAPDASRQRSARR